jgi:ABC-type dipeptide/oligopeptide/nickel transport system permease subunit
MRQGRPTTRFFAIRRGLAGAIVLAVIALFAIFADFLASDAPVLLWSDGSVHFLPAITEPARFAGRPAEQIAAGLAPGDVAVWPLCRHGPSVATLGATSETRGHPLGTDAFGRDAFARLVHGARPALGLGLAVALFALVVGGACGVAAGLMGGYTDMLVARLVEIAGVFPAVVVIALGQSLLREPSLLWIAAVVAIVRSADTARLVRVLVLRALPEDSVEAARALGASPARIARSHLLPRIGSQVLASTVFSVGAVVLTEASLSFLGLGQRTQTASWGEMLSEVGLGAGPLLLVPAAAALAVTLGALCLVADAVREVHASSR